MKIMKNKKKNNNEIIMKINNENENEIMK